MAAMTSQPETAPDYMHADATTCDRVLFGQQLSSYEA